jgi:hypothetical protein
MSLVDFNAELNPVDKTKPSAAGMHGMRKRSAYNRSSITLLTMESIYVR